MYPYNYTMQGYNSIYTPAIDPKGNDERLIGGGLLAPLLLGGVAGYAIGQNNYNRPYMFYTQPYYNYQPYPYPYYYPYNYYRR